MGKKEESIGRRGRKESEMKGKKVRDKTQGKKISTKTRKLDHLKQFQKHDSA